MSARRHIPILTGLLLGLAVLAAPATAAERIALVVGNAAYEAAPALSNPANDAALITTTLEEIGFEVVQAIDADRRAMGKAIQRFGARLRQAGPDAVGLFFYAGHGVQSAGENYLIPVSAHVETEADLELEALTLSSVVGQMRDAGNATNIVILDACRDNPYKSAVRSSTRGLARVTASGGTLIAFSAAPGQVAQDGTGGNSPYTRALSEAMRKPATTIEQALKGVLVAVEDATLREQTPWMQSSLRGDFYFNPATPEPAPEPGPIATAPPTPRGGPDAAAEIAYWNAVGTTDNPAVIEGFLAQFPNGVFAPAARELLASLSAPETPPGPDRPQADGPKPDGPKPGDTGTAPAGRDLARAIQTRLKDLGCAPGTPDGVWGRNSRAAAKRFADAAGLDLATDEPSPDLLARLNDGNALACPAAQTASRSTEPDETDLALPAATSLDGHWAYDMICPNNTDYTGHGSLDFAGSGGTWTGRYLAGQISNISGATGAVTFTVRYRDLIGRKIVETWSVNVSGRSMRGSVSGGYQNRCTITASK